MLGGRSAGMLKNHTLKLENRGALEISGITDILSFDETEIVLRVDDFDLAIKGDNLHISQLLLDEGKLTVSGRIDSCSYETPGLVKNLFRRKK